MKRFGFIFLIGMITFPSWSQVVDLPTEEADFGTEITNALAEAAGGGTTGTEFDQLWTSGRFDDTQKQLIIATTNEMKKKRLRVVPDLKGYLELLILASEDPQLTPDAFTQLLDMSQKIFEFYNYQDARKFMARLYNVLSNKAFYYSNYNKLYFNEGIISFEFVQPKVSDLIVLDYLPEEESEPEDEFISDDEVLENEDGWGSDDWGDDGWGDEGWEDSGWGDEDSDSWGEEDSFEEKETEEEEEEEFLEEEVVYTPPEFIQPDLEGPIMILENTDLIMATPYDSTIIEGTSGSMMFTSGIFAGEGGRTDWAAAGLSPDTVYCDLSSYSMRADKTGFLAENATLTYFDRLSSPVKGTYRFSSLKREEWEKTRFPQFKSYFNDNLLSGIGDDKLEVRGGFTLIGDEISTEAANGGFTSIKASNEGSRKFSAKGKRFFFQDSLIRSDRTSIAIYHYGDSLFHPALKFDYYPNSSTLRMVRDHTGYKYTHIYSSFLEMEIHASLIDWDLDYDSLNLSVLNARSQIPVTFESNEYYNEVRFNSLSGLYEFNPLLMAVGYSKKTGSRRFRSYDMAIKLKQTPNTIRGAMIDLMQKGFIEYNKKTDVVEIKEKAIHYVNSNRRRKDYDNLLITSISPGEPNATFYLSSQELKVRGLQDFFISKILDVYIEPADGEITLLSNRDFFFDGVVNAGNFRYIGREFRFDYDSFLMVLPTVDSIRLKVNTEVDGQKSTAKKNLNNQLVETGGILYINEPNNKSARKNFPQYPIFDASIGAVVYFNNEEILDGVYDRTIYFTVPPFTIDSVSSSDPAAIGFEGTFHSGGIFPDFPQKLTVMPDNSLGFVHNLPEEGFPLFGKMGTLYSTSLKLDNNGLQADGVIEYSTSIINSPEFIFYMDSVVGEGSNAVIQEATLPDADFPDVNVDRFKMKWLPLKDSMYISNLDEPFEMYNGSAFLDGTAIVSSDGLYGDGELLTRGSEINSRKFELRHDEIKARHAKIEVNSSDPEKPALAGDDVRIDMDLVEGSADIGPEREGIAALYFPYAQFKTSISNATWDLNNQIVSMKKADDVDIENSYFYATKEELDSLVFNATSAVYDINDLTLNISGIPYIIVADAKITPENGKVLIRENAQLEPLENATLVIDTLNQFHNLFDGTITILSRNKFEGSATYQYVNAVEDTFAIKMGAFELAEEKIRRDEVERFTVSSGEIKEEDRVVVSPGMKFKGIITMYANREVLDLDGFVKLDLKNIPDYDTWIKYKTSADVQEVIFPFNESETEEGDPLTAGLHFDGDDFELYGTFVTDKRSFGDEDFFVPSGLLSHDLVGEQYKIVDFYKSTGESFQGRSFTFSDQTADVEFEGPLKFFPGNNKVSVQASGSGTGNLNTNEYSLNSFLAFNFNIPTQALDAMAEDIEKAVEVMSPEEADPDKTALLYKVAEIAGDKAAKEYEERSLTDYVPLVSISPNLVKSLVLSNVNFEWSSEYKAFFSKGKVGLSNIKRYDINALLTGFVEIKKSFEGETVNIFLQISPSTWYFFSYDGSRMLLYSSNSEFNDIVSSKSNIAKAGIGEFVTVLGDLDETLYFINAFRNVYYNQDDPYRLDAPESADDFDAFDVIEDEEPEPDSEEKEEEEEEEDDFLPFGVEEDEEDEEEEEDGF